MTRKLVRVLLITCLILPIFGFASSPNQAKPNVVFIITDDQGYGDLSCHGNPILKTPALDDLYAESVRLTNYHVSPTCAPTRGALMSGHYTNRAGPWHTVLGRSFLKIDQITWGDVFSKNGYSAGMFGKWHLGDNYPFRPEDRGFDEVVAHHGGGVGQTPDAWNNAYFDDTYHHNGELEKYEGYCTDVFFSEAIRFMGECADQGKPFVAYISPNAPHGPFLCPDKYWKPYAEQGISDREAIFFGMIANIDENVAHLRKWLKDNDLDKNTIFVFTTDNGTASGRRIFNSGMRGGKVSEYEGGHRVPFFIHWPNGGLTEGRDIQNVTAHIDVLPTLIDLCGIDGPTNYAFDGRSLVSLLFDLPIGFPDRAIVVDNQRVVTPEKWKNCSVMTNDWRLVNGTELYAINEDPGQDSDLAAQYPAIVEKLRAEYESWWAGLEEDMKKLPAIVVGHPAESPSVLTAHDCIVESKVVAWNQTHIRKGEGDLGYWSLDVHEAGEYTISISRYPREANAAIAQDIPAGAAVPGLDSYRSSPGVGFDVETVGIKAGSIKMEQAVSSTDKEVTFKTRLEKGKLKLWSWFKSEDGNKMPAYYAYVERVK